MTTYISPQPKLQFLDNNGVPLSGGKVYTYAAGTTTPLTTYTDYTGNTANSNPVILDSRGECSIWLGTSSYKFKLATSTDVEVWTVDNISVLTSSANITYVESGTGAVTETVQAKLRLGYVYPEDFGAAGDGTTNDTTALQNAINTGRDVYLAAGKTYLHTTALSVTTNYQWVGGPGILKTSGAINSVNVGGSSIGVKLSLNFNSPGQTTGYAIYISSADRVTIERAYLYDAFGALYVESANTVQVEWMWGIVRGPGIKWFGNATKRSDILSINFCVLDPGPDYYGFEWDGNCNSLNVKYMGLVCGASNTTQSSYGFIIQNTVGGYKSATSGYIAGTTMTLGSAPANPILVGMTVSGTGVTAGTTVTGITNPTNYTVSISQTVGSALYPVTLSTVPAFYPAIGRVGQVEIDYAKAAAIKILVGVDYDFVMPYVTGAASDGMYVDPSIDSYNVRVTGGKLIGNGGYGINNTTAGILLTSGSVQLTNNTSGATNGNVWNLAPTQAVDDYFYLNLGGDKTLANGTSQINFYPTDYISHARSSRQLNFLMGGTGIFQIGTTSANALAPFTLKTYTVATLPASPVKGWTAMVTDANATTFASTVAGGGSNNVPVYYDGTNWRIG